VLTGFRLDSGGAVPVVRGISNGRQPPAPPTGTVTQTGVLLPSEGTGDRAEPSGSPTTVNLAALAQRWPPTLVNGFATLEAAASRAQSLEPAPVALPSSHGRLRNGFYALQWWVFAAFAVAMAVRMARDLGREAAEHGDPDADPGDDSGPQQPRIGGPTADENPADETPADQTTADPTPASRADRRPDPASMRPR
jgi:cytochrome oxidase assembly protein ShyY1